MKIRFEGISKKQTDAIKEIKELLGIELDTKGILVTVLKGNKDIRIKEESSGFILEYGREHQFIRAVGLLVENLKNNKDPQLLEVPIYEHLGVMIDCSRNAVPKREAFCSMVKYLALMGYSTIQLYMEDTFELDKYPYAGYLRGRYSRKELKEMDSYAAIFGIEVIPAIQTLAHMDQVLKWGAMEELRDVGDIFLIDSEKTYEYIEEIIKTMSECFMSKRINIGMDEADMVGLGKYLDNHGYVDRMELMIRHMNRVVGITEKYGLEPMMWSDMIFRLLNKGEYYAADSVFEPDMVKKIPDNLTFVYWDYYSEEKETYDAMIEKHLEFSPNIIFAGGAWRWSGYSPNSHFSEKVGRCAHDSCKEKGIKEVLITLWGDNGSECSLFSVLPALAMWAELCYRDKSDNIHMEERFRTCIGMGYEDFMNLDLLMLTPDNEGSGRIVLNPPKYIFYQDILLGLFDKHIDGEAYREHFHFCGENFNVMRKRNGCFNYIFETQYQMAKILELKCVAGIQLREAYKKDDRNILEVYASKLLPKLIEDIKEFLEAFHVQWLKENKVFGLDNIDLRIGGLIQRVSTAKSRIEQYLNNDIERIDELEEELLTFAGEEEGGPTRVSYWHYMVTPSILSHI
ncbi:MAG: family 20 glycosylhydrolase [Anaerocolumna aminovalerica]|uniref:family 20 glycosylhydrolase n=1 Tax=Anaerocolumna aminovalerica TaxID=1527 RepID=UPI00290F1F51|nr:family 20 glycosylhydrolase [Anaerocolumna aminovalerica]MDU6266275.1 family 20 glycosylhydrolase [Anaerocolumna aminovalerica]